MSKVKVLFLTANPAGTQPLQLDEEIRRITTKIRAAEYRDSLELVSRWAVRPDDLLQALLEVKPHVVHFSGHGSPVAELFLLDDRGNPKPVSKEALIHLFRILKDNVRVVVLNACSSRPQAEALAETIDCTIGMNRPIGDEAAIVFAASFYRALGFGRSVREAFELGRVALLLEGIPEDQTPELLTHPGIDASGLVLITPSVAATPSVLEAARFVSYRAENINDSSIIQGENIKSYTNRTLNSGRPEAKGPGKRVGVSGRSALVRDLSGLAPTDWLTLVAAIEGAAFHISRIGTVAEQVAELVRWAESPTGPGLVTIAKAAKELRLRP